MKVTTNLTLLEIQIMYSDYVSVTLLIKNILFAKRNFWNRAEIMCLV